MSDALKLNGSDLNLDDFVRVVRHNCQVEIASEALIKIQNGRKRVETLLENNTVAYGINTGFGSLCDTQIPSDQLENLQLNLIKSHASGTGDPLPNDVVRGMLLLRANSLINDVSGVRSETIHRILDLLNLQIIPVVPEHGSLGASGDLIPLAHMSLVLIGLGQAQLNDHTLEGKLALEEANLKPIVLQAKEGLALINGTAASTALAVLALWDAIKLVFIADVACALTLEALGGNSAPFSEVIHRYRPHEGQQKSAEIIRQLTEGSHLLGSSGHVQDAYSLRCSPQVHGATRDAVKYAESVLSIEMNSVTDNPLIIDHDGTIEGVSGGNFHGQPIAITADLLCIAVSELGSISERRLEHLLNPQLSGLHPFLTKHSGIHSGFMSAQILAASLVSENKICSHPATVDSIPVSANQEDHVSMSAHAGRKLRRIIKNVEEILAIELLAGAQAIDLRPATPSQLGPGTTMAYKAIRDCIPPLEEDRELAPDITKIADLIHSGILIEALEKLVHD
ncbi:MAG: histidine ammonia-lyase [Candidatus Hodarchaeales archaeon]|jgi:histidine ammonia-lyase